MATQYTAGLASGEVLTAATMNQIGAAWEDWVPTWTGTVTNPAIGNGFIGGRYAQIQKIVIADGYIIPGSTTSYGSGTYRIGVPVASVSTNGLVGYASFFDASAGYIAYSGVATRVTSTTVEFRIGNGLNIFSPTVPVNPFAQSDQVRFQLIYQAA